MDDPRSQLLMGAAEQQGMHFPSDEAPEDNALASQVIQLHHPDGRRDIDVRALLHFVQNIIDLATLAVEGGSEGTVSNSKDSYKTIHLVVNRIVCQMTCKVRSGVDAHNTILELLDILKHYSWLGKVGVILVAFAVTYGHFWLLVQICSSNALGKANKRLPMVVEERGAFRQWFDATNNLIKDTLETARCMAEFGELPNVYLTPHDLDAVANIFPIPVYYIVRSVVYATNITTMSSRELQSNVSNDQSCELSNLAQRLKSITEDLRKTLSTLHQLIEERKDNDDYYRIRKVINDTIHIDNIFVLRALIDAKNDVTPLYDGVNKKRVNLDLLRKRHVLLLISCLDITHEELCVLEQSYTKSREDSYDIVWLPVIDDINVWTDAKNIKFEMLKYSMPWYSVDHPLMIENAAIKFIKKEWHFKGRPILVVLDPQGKVVSPNAIHMMWIWQSTAFPFTSAREEALWAQETWRLELLVNGIDQKISDWIREEKYIFVFGGDEMEWIRKFTKEAHAVARCLGVSVEMVYVGRSRNKELVRRVTDCIVIEKLSHCWNDPTFVWYFWTRIKCMIYSKVQMGRVHDQGDEILQEILTLNSHDLSDGGWAILAKGSKIIVNGHGKIALYTLEEFEQWKEIAQKQGLDVGFGLHYRELRSYPSIKIEFPSNVVVPKSMLCPDCRRNMKIYSYFICAHED